MPAQLLSTAASLCKHEAAENPSLTAICHKSLIKFNSRTAYTPRFILSNLAAWEFQTRSMSRVREQAPFFRVQMLPRAVPTLNLKP